MTLHLSTDGEVKIDMKDYVAKMLIIAPTDMVDKSVTPAEQHLFKVSNQPIALDESQAQVFHFYVEKLLFHVKEHTLTSKHQLHS
jgi:hypothetical protein